MTAIFEGEFFVNFVFFLKNFTLFLVCFFTFISCGRDETQEPGQSDTLTIGRRKLSEGRIAGLLKNAGFPAHTINTMVCISKFESSQATDSNNYNRSNKTWDKGLFQINDVHLSPRELCYGMGDMYNEYINTACAYRVYRAQGFRAWYGYRNNKFTCDRYKNVTPEPVGGGKTNTCNTEQFTICKKFGGGKECSVKWNCG